MSVIVLQRPQGVVLGNCLAASIDEDYAGFATVNTYTPHNLTEGQQVYISSDIEDYNGFFPVHVIDGFHFFLVDPHGNYVAYVQDAGITYCPSESEHGWNCVHLPIAYRLRSDLYPLNEVDTARTVSSYSNDNGLINLNLSGSLGTFDELSWIFIDGAESEAVNGVFQVMNKLSTSDVTIDLAYNSLYDFTGATVILRYGSYNIVVKVYSGLPSGHRWESRKPITEVADLRLIPDENNEVFFSIAEILKASVESTNNPLLGSLPNNLDAFTGFYISYAESYDVSDGYTLNTEETAFTDDTFDGWGINAKLPFKNQFSGFMSDYLGRALTGFSSLTAFVGRYFDLSFINNFSLIVTLTILKRLNSSTVLTTSTTYNNLGAGVIRIPISIESSYDEYCVSADASGVGTFSLAGFLNRNSGDAAWTLGAVPSVAAVANLRTDILYDDFAFVAGITYQISIPFTVSSATVGTLRVVGMDASFNIVSSDVRVFTTSGTPQMDLLAVPGMIYIGIDVVTANNRTVTITGLTYEIDDYPLLEGTCLTVDNKCSTWDIYLGWLNNLGGYDYWLFRGAKDYIVNIEGTEEVQDNIFPEWPNSYGENAHTINKQVSRDSRKQILVRTDHITLEQLQALEFIKKSISVQIVNSRSDIRTVIVDADSFTSYKDEDKLYTMSFTISYTDKEPVQRR